MIAAIFDHCGKAIYLQTRLTKAGHTLTGTIGQADVLLLDCDWRWAPPRPEMIAAAEAAGVPVVLYPHGGQPLTFIYDGLTVADPRVAVRLEHGPGQLDLTEFFDDPVPNQHPVGWLYSPTEPFTPVDKPRRVLFAPQHPNIEMLQSPNGIVDPAPAMNHRVYQQLLELGYDLTVTIVGPAHRNGVYPHPRARIIQNHLMDFGLTYPLIHDADIVVAAGTTAAAAVACGKPTVMLGQSDLTDYIDGTYQEARHADDYRDLIRYPLDADRDDLEPLIARACAGDPAAAEWRARYIGDDGTAAAIELIELLVGEPVSEPAAIIPTVNQPETFTECEVCHTPKTGKQTRHQYCPECAEWDAAGRPQRNVTIQGVTAHAGVRSNWNEGE